MMDRLRINRLWTPDDDALRAFLHSGKDPTAIAAKLARSVPAVRGRAHKLNILLRMSTAKRKPSARG